jgi:hypothetical protein
MNPLSQTHAAAGEPPPVSTGVCGTGNTWWSRNWVWVLVLSCCSAAALFFGGIALVVAAAFGAMRTSGACEEAVARAESSPAVVQALGAPLDVGWFVTGTLNPGRSADIAIPVTGPRGSARIHAVASKAGDTWVFSTLTVILPARGEPLSLVAKDQPRGRPPSPRPE